MVIRSEALLDEMKTITNADGVIGAGSTRQKDDRVIAAALGVHAWQDAFLPELYERQWTKAERFKQNHQWRQPGETSFKRTFPIGFHGSTKGPNSERILVSAIDSSLGAAIVTT